jgi:2-keto-myo-inositol isomerase
MNELYLNGATLMTTPTPRQLEVALKAGFSGIEARAERLRGRERRGELEATAAALKEMGGRVLSLNGLGLQALPGGRLDTRKLEADLPELLDIAAALGAGLLLVVPLRAAGVSFEAALEGMREGLAQAQAAAKTYGIRLGFEFLGFADCPVNTAARALEVTRPLPDVGFVPDSCHVYASGSSFRDFPAHRLHLVHLNDCPRPASMAIEDGDRVLPGEGRIPLRQYLQDLRSSGFGGPWSLETFNETLWKEDPEQVAIRGFRALRSLLLG